MPCPLAGYRIDEKAARLVAGFVVLGTLIGLRLPQPWNQVVFLFLAMDFGVRAISRPRWSPLGRLAGILLKALGVKPEWRDAGPKRFAARIGLGFTLVLAGLPAFATAGAALGVAAVLLVCAILESVFGFCVGCQVWNAWYVLLDHLKASGGKPEA